MIIINGKPYRTLKEPIYENGKRVLKVFVNGDQAYPEVYKKPEIGASGNILKIRGKHTTELNLYSDGEWASSERYPVYSETIRCTISYAAYIRNVPASKEGKIILENDKVMAPYFRARNFIDYMDPKYEASAKFDHNNMWFTAYPHFGSAEADYGEIYFPVVPSYDHYTNYIGLHGSSYSLPTFAKIIFKVKIDPFYIPSERYGVWPATYSSVRFNKNFIYRPSLFNNKIFTIYSNFPTNSTGNINLVSSFQPNIIWLVTDTNGNLYRSLDLDYYRKNDICVMTMKFHYDGYVYHDSNDPKCPFTIDIGFIDVAKNGAIAYSGDTVSKPIYLETGLNYNYFICSPDEILYLGNELDPETNKEVSIITKEDLIDFDGSEEVIDPIIERRGYTTTDEEKLYTEVESDDAIIKQGIYGIYTTTVHCPNATEIEQYAFYSNVRLIYAIFPNVTTIGQGAFYGCGGLAVADFPSLLSIPELCFTYSIVLKTISFPACTSIGSSSFLSCRSLTSVSFPVCTNIGNYAFMNCSSLTKATFPACISIESFAFLSCSSLATVSFPACTSIGSGGFKYCGNLDAFEAPNLITIREEGFAYCSSLKNAIIPRVEIIESAAFAGCSSLSSLTLLTVSFIAYQAFQNCVNLESVFLPGPYVCRTNGTMFNNTKIGTGQGSILVPESLVSTYKTATGWSEYSSVITAI